MNQFSVVNSASKDEVAGPLRRAVQRELRAAPELASAKVPVGGLVIWGSSLGWPEWLLQGSSIKSGALVPTCITISDELILHANLLDRLGNAALLRGYLFDNYQPFDGKNLKAIECAPNLRALYKVLIDWASFQNCHIDIDFSESTAGCTISVSFAPQFQAIGHFMEHYMLAAWFRVTIALSSQMKDTAMGDTPFLAVHARNGSLELASFFRALTDVDVNLASDKSTLFVDAALADRDNPKSDPVAWQQTLDRIATLNRVQQDAFSEEAVRDRIRKSLLNLHRVPPLNEIAEEQGVSERTMSRELASRGLQYNRLASEVRMEMARDLVEGGEHRLSGIAQLLGYGSTASFGRAFRQEFGTSPAKWRVAG